MGKFTIAVDAALAPIMPRYLEIRSEELGQLEQAIASGDAEATRLLGHRLKGTGTSYGFPKLTELGAAIEIAGREGEISQAAQLAALVRDYLENMEIAYEEQA